MDWSYENSSLIMYSGRVPTLSGAYHNRKAIQVIAIIRWILWAPTVQCLKAVKSRIERSNVTESAGRSVGLGSRLEVNSNLSLDLIYLLISWQKLSDLYLNLLSSLSWQSSVEGQGLSSHVQIYTGPLRNDICSLSQICFEIIGVPSRLTPSVESSAGHETTVTLRHLTRMIFSQISTVYWTLSEGKWWYLGLEPDEKQIIWIASEPHDLTRFRTGYRNENSLTVTRQ